MGYRARKGNDGRSKLHAVRQHRTSKNHAGLSACIHRCVGGEGLRKVRNYIMKALDFGVESGYLVPTDRTYRMLRVSSDLLAKKKRQSTRNRTRCSRKTCEKWAARRNYDDEMEDEETRSSPRFEDYPVQDARRKRKPHRRRSVSKSRSRRRSRSKQRRRRGRSSGNPKEAGEDDDEEDYDTADNSVKKTSDKEHTSKELKSSRSKTQYNGKSNGKEADDISEVSVDEDDTDEDDDKKGNDNTKS